MDYSTEATLFTVTSTSALSALLHDLTSAETTAFYDGSTVPLITENFTSSNEPSTGETSTTRESSTPGIVMPKFSSLEELLSQYWEYTVARDLALFGYPAIIIFGTVGNLMTLVIMLGKQMRHSTTCFYMSTIALLDTSVLYFACLRQWLAQAHDQDALGLSNAACKTLNFFSYTCFDIAVWLLVVMTVERYLVVQFPLHASKFLSIPRARVVVLILILAMVFINVHFFWTVELDSMRRCSYLDEFEHFHDNIWPWIDACVYSFVPFGLLLLFNVMIIVVHRRSVIFRRTTLNISGSRNTTLTNQGTQLHLSAMLLIVTFTFLLLSSPNVILISVRHVYFDFSTRIDDIRDVAVYRFVATVTNFCLYLNHAINFFLYCISGQKFRRELWRILSCQTCSRQPRSSAFSDTTSRTFRLSESSTPSSPKSYRRDTEHYF